MGFTPMISKLLIFAFVVVFPVIGYIIGDIADQWLSYYKGEEHFSDICINTLHGKFNDGQCWIPTLTGDVKMKFYLSDGVAGINDIINCSNGTKTAWIDPTMWNGKNYGC